MTFVLPDLPYDESALEPAMSRETVNLHYDKHHRGYVDKLNALVAETPLADRSLEEVIRTTADSEKHRAVFNNAAQAWNHTFFWNSLSPEMSGPPDGELGDLIERDFGSFEAFKESFKAAATGQFGSGWAWLAIDGGRLQTMATPNAQPPFIRGAVPLIACDVWEHAYYLDHRNDRAAFVDAFLDKMINWRFAAKNLELREKRATSASRSSDQSGRVEIAA